MIKPQTRNIICPFCKLTWLCPANERTYFCYSCSVVLFTRQLTGHHSQYERREFSMSRLKEWWINWTTDLIVWLIRR